MANSLGWIVEMVHKARVEHTEAPDEWLRRQLATLEKEDAK